MICQKLMSKMFLFGPVFGAILAAVIVVGCTGDAGHSDGRDSDRATVSQASSEREGSDSGEEHSGGREGSGEHGTGGDGGGESREAAMSSPITPLGQSWNGVLGGLAVSMQYDAATRSVHGTVRNSLSEKLCYVQAEPHLKSGTNTVGELGPEKLGDLNPGQETTSNLSVASEPELTGVSFDGYVVHMEVFDCTGPGPAVHTGRRRYAEGSGADSLALDETYDAVRSGARLILKYDAPSNSFKGTVENTTKWRAGPGQDRSTPFQRSGARSNDSDGHGSRRGGNGQPARDAGVVHRMDSTRRDRHRRRGERVGRGASGWW